MLFHYIVNSQHPEYYWNYSEGDSDNYDHDKTVKIKSILLEQNIRSSLYVTACTSRL